MKEKETTRKKTRIAVLFLALGIIFAILLFFSHHKWEKIKLPESVTLEQKFPAKEIEMVADAVAIHFYRNAIKISREDFFRISSSPKIKKIYANYNILRINGDINSRVGIFYFWRHPEGWMESYTEPFLSPPPIKNICWKLEKVSLNESRDGVKLFYIPKISDLAISGITTTVSFIMLIICLVIAGLIWFLSSPKLNF